MADSFAGIATFLVLDGSVDRSAPLTYDIQPIPSSDTYYVDVGGRQGITRKLLLKFDNDTDYFNFEAQRGNIGTLVCFDTNAPALLLDVQRTSRNPPGSSTEATASFLML